MVTLYNKFTTNTIYLFYLLNIDEIVNHTKHKYKSVSTHIWQLLTALTMLKLRKKYQKLSEHLLVLECSFLALLLFIIDFVLNVYVA